MAFSHPAQGPSAKSRLGKAPSNSAGSLSERSMSERSIWAASVRLLAHSLFVASVSAASLCVANYPESRAEPVTLEELQQRLQVLEAAKKPLPIEWYGWLELEMNQSHLDELRKPNGKSNAAGDLTLATFALGADLDLSTGLTAHIHVLYEQDATPLDVDEAYVTQESAQWDMALTAGQMYLPFGQFHQHQVNDTFMQTLAETRATALLLNGFNQGPLQLNGYLFKGHNDNSIETFGGRVQWQNEQLTLSLDYVSDVMQSDGVQTWLEESSLQDSRLESVPAVNAFALWRLPLAGTSWEVSWEYMTAALDKNNPLQLQGKDLSASHGQVAMSWPDQSPMTLSVGHQRAQNLEALGVANERLSLGLNTELNNKIGVAFEWWLDHFNKNDLGTDASSTRVQSVALLLSRGF